MISQRYIYFLMDVNETRDWISQESWFDSWAGQEISVIFKASRLALGPTLFPIHWVLGVLSLQWLGCEADHWTLSNAEVRNRVKLCPASPYSFTAQTGTTFIFPDLTFSLLYFMDVNSQQLSMASTNCEKPKMVWMQSDKSCFTFLKYNDRHDSTFHEILISHAFKDMLQDKQYRYEQHLLRTMDMTS